MDRESLIESINFALRFKTNLRVKWGHDLESYAAAKRILEHLERCGYEVTKRPPPKLHSTR